MYTILQVTATYGLTMSESLPGYDAWKLASPYDQYDDEDEPEEDDDEAWVDSQRRAFVESLGVEKTPLLTQEEFDCTICTARHSEWLRWLALHERRG